MAKVISLNKVRKRKASEDSARQATENRVRFGRTHDEKQRELAEMKEAERRLNLLRREPPPETQD